MLLTPLLAAALSAYADAPALRPNHALPRLAAEDAAYVPPIGPTAAQGPLFTETLWAGLKAPDAAALQGLAARVPGLKTALVRELTPAALDAVLAEAAARGLSPTDLFTDPGLNEGRVFYAPGAAVARAYAGYEIAVITLAEGQDTGGKPYHLQALLAGDKSVEMLYDRDGFRTKNPYFNDYDYTLASRVSHGILGPGDLSVEGITVEAGWVRPVIKRFTKVGPDRIRVETNWGTREKPVRPIRRKP